MKAPRTSQAAAVSSPVSIQRWTIERLDEDAGMARIEQVPMRSEHVTQKLLKQLSTLGLEAGADRLELWDLARVRTQRLRIRDLPETLSLKAEEQTALSENMVFWVLIRGRRKRPESVFHATELARKTSKDLYTEVIAGKGVKP